MLTGAEIASLVLAILPLLISAVEHRDVGLEPANALIFRKKYKIALRCTVDENKMLFRQCCEKILSMAEVENIADLLREKDKAKLTKLWDNPQMQKALDTTFGQQDLTVILSRIHEIQKYVNRLEKYSEAGIFVHTVQSTSRAKDIKRLGKAILALQNVLEREALSITIGTAGTAWYEEIERMKSTRTHLQNIYACVDLSWNCACKSHHVVNFQCREAQDADLKIILAPFSSRSGTGNKPSKSPWQIRPLQISTSKRTKSNTALPKTTSLCESLRTTGLPALAETSSDYQYLVQVSTLLPDPKSLIPISKASSTRLKLPRDRIAVGAKLLITVLQQHDVPWLQPGWTTNDVFIRSGTNCSLCPYFEGTFNTTNTPATEKPFKPFYSRNPTLYSLGVALIEIVMGSTMENLINDDDRNMASQDPAWTRACAAFRLCSELSDHLIPPAYRDATRYCLTGEFGMEIKGKELSDDDLFSMVYRRAAKPLMELIAIGNY